jgi:hypothetical protein
MNRVVRPGAGWYRGDFHAHTNQSDGALPPPEFAALARANGLDFVAITDHNTLGAYPLFGEQPGLLILPGVEITLQEGDYNVFGVQARHDWMEPIFAAGIRLYEPLPAGVTTSGLMRQAAEAGLLNSINHPLLNPLGWQDPATDLRLIHCLEVCNDPSWPPNDHANPQAVALWTELLNAGHRPAALGGSDYHVPVPRPDDPPGKPAEVLGLPGTYVHAAELSGAAILDAVRARRAFVSMGPWLEFEARLDGRAYGIGADAGPVSGEAELRARVRDPRAGKPQGGGAATIVRNGETIVAAQLADGQAEFNWTGPVRADEPAWFRLDVFETGGRFVGLTNPIFFGPRPEPRRIYFGDFAAGPR